MTIEPLPTQYNGPGGYQAIIPGASQKVSISGSSAQATNAVSTSTTLVRLLADTDTWITFGSNPTAATDGTSMFLPAGVPEYFGIHPGYKIAGIQASASGNLYITEGA